MTTTTEPVPLRSTKPGEMYHPGWCSPDHCRADGIGKTHESALVEVAGLTVSVTQAVMPADHFAHAVIILESDPADDEGSVVTLRLGEIPAFTKTLLDFYCQHP